jgi:5-methylcytosine-specific restriction endonuclease McrA
MKTVVDEVTGDEFDLRWTDAYTAEINAVYNGWCQHPTTELRRRIIASGQVTYWHQCQTCGRFLGNAVRKPDDADRIPDADTTLEARYDAQRAAERHEIEQRHVRIQKREKAQWWRRYNEYLDSPAWQARRRAVMTRSGGICEGCGSRPATQVHHLTYANVCNEFLWELRAVCDHCHERCHPESQETAMAD